MLKFGSLLARIVMAAALFPLSARAVTYDPVYFEEYPEILSFQELELLNPEARADYIEDLRGIMADMARVTALNGYARSGLANSFYALFVELVPLPAACAAAAEKTPGGKPIMECPKAEKSGAGVGSDLNKPLSCARGGFFSKPAEGAKRAKSTATPRGGRKCVGVTTFPPNAGRSAAKITCKENGKEMCNPIVYCGKKGKGGKTEPFCYGGDEDDEKACSKMLDDELKRLNAGTSGHSKQKKCDPFDKATFGEIPALQNEIGDLRENWKGLCGDKKFAAKFCEHCKRMGERLKESNLRAQSSAGRPGVNVTNRAPANRDTRRPVYGNPYPMPGDSSADSAPYCTPYPSCVYSTR